uniref:Uncharacterized protein n=1 Tax=Trypanosoma congolense (strain IL3000) TaxID=1068625 RepID=G0UJB5_TRYCI|nr:conserved hypothetical protein [Trypanosoma congolense IL3000]
MLGRERKAKEKRLQQARRKEELNKIYTQLQAVIQAGRAGTSEVGGTDDNSDASVLDEGRNNIVLTNVSDLGKARSSDPPKKGKGYSSRDRTLPAIFAEQRQTSYKVDLLCTELKGAISKMEFEYVRRRRALQAGAFDDLRSHAGTNARPAPSAAKLQKYRERCTTSEDGEVAIDCTVNDSGGDAPRGRCSADVHRVRIAAADEGLRDDQSVADYAAEPDVPLYGAGRTLRSEIEVMDDSIKKVSHCVASMSQLEEMDSGTPWWESAMLVREMKALSIRGNYHVRNILRWSLCAQDHFLMDVVSKNAQSARCSEEMVYMREQVGLFEKRNEQSKKVLAEAEAEIDALKESLVKASQVKSGMLEKVLELAQETGRVPQSCTSVQCAEMVMLLEHTKFPVILHADVERVKAWLQRRTVLDM